MNKLLYCKIIFLLKLIIIGKDDQCVKIDTIKHCAILSFYNNKYLCGSC